MTRHLHVGLLLCTLVGCATQGGAPPRQDTATAPVTTQAIMNGPVLPKPEGPVPLRAPAFVMRVWVAPWEAANGDLNAPGYVYTEIEARRWTLGLPAEPRHGRVITPLQIEDRPETKAPLAPTKAPRGEHGNAPGERPASNLFSS